MPNIEKRYGHPLDTHFNKIIDIIKRNQSDPTLNSKIPFDAFLRKDIDPESLAQELLKDYRRIKSVAMQKKLLGIPEYHYITRTYINSLFVNGKKKAVLLPVYRGYDEFNKEARRIYEEVYSEAYGEVDIVPIYTDILIPFDGAIHCITNTVPSAKRKD